MANKFNPATAKKVSDIPTRGGWERYQDLRNQSQSQYDLPEARRIEADLPDELRQPFNRAIDFPRSEDEKIRAIQGVLPEVKVGRDKYGHTILGYKGKGYYLNKPGISEQDIFDVGGDVVTQGPLARVGGAAGGAILGTAGRIAGTGLGAGAGSIARDMTAGAVTEGDAFGQIDPLSAILSAGVAGITEGIAGGRRGSGYTADLTDQAGRLTPVGEAALARAGIDPAVMDPTFISQYRIAQSRGAPPADAAIYAEAQSMPSPVPLTRPDITGNARDQTLLAAARRGGAYGGSEGEQIAQGSANAVNTALQENVDILRNRISGGANRVNELGQGVDIARQRIAQDRNTLRGLINDAYDHARQSGAALAPQSVDGLRRWLQQGYANTFNPATAPQTLAVINSLQLPQTGGRVTSVSLNSIENVRQHLRSISQGHGPEATAAGSAIRQLDEFLDGIVDTAFVRGDRSALEAFQASRALRTRMRRYYESDNIISRLIEQNPETGQFTLNAQEAANLVFNAASLGGKNGATQALRRMRAVMGRNPDGDARWNAIREEAFLRLMRGTGEAGERATDLTRMFSGDRFARSLETVMVNQPGLMRVLFTPQELTQFAKLRNVALRATSRRPGVVNTSNTFTVGKILDSFGFLGKMSNLVSKAAFNRFGQGAEANRIRGMVENPLGRERTRPSGIAGAAGAFFGPPLAEEIKEK